MKTTTSITIDIELYMSAKNYYDNLSKRISELITADLDIQKSKNPESFEDYKKKLSEKEAEVTILKEKIAHNDKKNMVLYSSSTDEE